MAAKESNCVDCIIDSYDIYTLGAVDTVGERQKKKLKYTSRARYECDNKDGKKSNDMQSVACRMEGVELREAKDSVLNDTGIANRSLEHI